MNTVPKIRVRNVNKGKVNPDGDFILYWMISNRRLKWNYSLDRAIEWAVELNKPLVILEPLRCDYEWAGDRFHKFIVEGMACNYRLAKDRRVCYYPYLEPRKNAGKGLVKSFSKHACAVISDEFPAFFIPGMLKKAALQIKSSFELVDSNGILPMASTDREFTSAYSFRRFLQKQLPSHVMDHPRKSPLKKLEIPVLKRLPDQITEKWPAVPFSDLEKCETKISNIPIDHSVGAVARRGGFIEAEKLLKTFIKNKIPFYSEHRNNPEEDVTSTLSPYLHFGHISSHEIFYSVQEKEKWHIGKLSQTSSGKRAGWWGMNEYSEAFLDQLITWRELGFNMCRNNRKYAEYESLPEWARNTLNIHEMDERKYIYSLKQFEEAQTHDPLWNAAQRQLLREGIIHNYLRMLWGKKVLEWTPTPGNALEILLHLNNKYALDGRDPNSYSGVFWIFGRYDRAWGPEREIFGKIRYMSSKNTERKVSVKNYLKKYS